jgi:O-antigen/teichoic acid export membrane protein
LKKNTYSLSLSHIFKSLKYVSSVTLLTVIIGVITTKIIATYGGVEVLGRLEIYRKILGLLVPVLAAGTGVIIVQKISNLRGMNNIANILSEILLLLIVQIIIAAVLFTFFADDIAILVFSNSIKDITSIRIVIVMAVFVLLTQLLTALINGKINLKKVGIINITIAFTTMLAAYPLIFLGDYGIALLVGFGSVSGSILGIYFVIKTYKGSLCNIKLKFSNKQSISIISIWLIAHPLVTSLLFLYIPVLVNNYYGAESLGLYSSVVMVSSILTMVLMSSMKIYFLPTLGAIDSEEDKHIYINRVIYLLLIILFPIIAIIIFFSEEVLLLLFSKEFVVAAELLKIQILSVLLVAFCWPYANYILHDKKYKIYFIIDAIWASSMALIIWLLVSNNFPLNVVPMVFVAGSLLSFMLYIYIVYKEYGRNILSKENINLGLLFGVILACLYFSIKYALYEQGIFLVIIVSYMYFLYRKLIIEGGSL